MRVGATAGIDNATLCVEEITPDGERVVVLREDIDLYAGGSMPLPPYIQRESDAEDAMRYQTVLRIRLGRSRSDCRSSLHPDFSDSASFVTLHGTGHISQPLENITEHRMHAELFPSRLPPRQNRSAGRIVAVGTTVVRVLNRQPRRWKARRTGRFHRYFHLSSISVSSCRCSANEFSFAAFNFAHAGKRVCWPRVFAPCLSRGNSRALPFLQLRRLYADSVGEAVGFPWDDKVVPTDLR